MKKREHNVWAKMFPSINTHHLQNEKPTLCCRICTLMVHTENSIEKKNSYCVTGKHMQYYNRRKQEGKEEGQRLQMHGKFL